MLSLFSFPHHSELQDGSPAPGMVGRNPVPVLGLVLAVLTQLWVGRD